MEMPKPTKFHQKLEALVGEWSGDEVMHASPMNPQECRTFGRYTSRWVTDGFAVVQEYEQFTGDVVTFRGHGVFTYDTNEDCYLWYWFDSMGNVPCTATKGQWNGDTIVWQNQSPMGHARYTHRFRKDGRCEFSIECSQDGKQWMPMMQGNYVKAKAAAKAAKPAKVAKAAAKAEKKAAPKGAKKTAGKKSKR